MRTLRYALSVCLLVLPALLPAQVRTPCCNEAACRQEAAALAAQLDRQLQPLPPPSTTADSNRAALRRLEQQDAPAYRQLRATARTVIAFIEPADRWDCFMAALPADRSVAVNGWLIYLNDQDNPPHFPSPEFCGGWRRRLELSQGAHNFLRDDMAYLGSLRYYFIYTFGKKDSCGNRLRLMAGPVFFQRNRSAYLMAGLRLGYRLKDLMSVNPPIFVGNLSLFGEYNTTFKKESYAALGIEAQLGGFGVNLSATHHPRTGRQGFLVGLLVMNKPKKR